MSAAGVFRADDLAVLFLLLRWIYKKNFYGGTVFWALLAFYGLFRFLVEFVREPDVQIGFDLVHLRGGQIGRAHV